MHTIDGETSWCGSGEELSIGIEASVVDNDRRSRRD
jgi:hypothetical protein